MNQLLNQYLALDSAEEQAMFVGKVKERYSRLARWFEILARESRTTTSLFTHSPAPVAEDLLDSASRQPTPDLEPGTRLGPWRIHSYVGAGGMGKVYRGERADGAFEMDVAIKLIGSRRSALADHLRHECRLLAKLDHPGVTRLIDAGITDEEEPFVVMEWVEGESLEQWLDQDHIDIEARLSLFCEVAEAVAHAHQRLIVHGDIKPDNIRITAEGRVKLMDFGVARLVSEDAGGSRALAALTPAFASPEQLEDGTLTTRSDVWSLGALLFWTLAGQVFDRQRTVAEQVELPAALPRKREVEAIIIKACANNPGDRYPGVEGLIRDLKSYRSSYPVDALPATRRYLFGRFLARNRLAMTAAGVIGLLVLAGIGGVAWQAEQTRQEAERAQAEAERARAASERTAAVRDFLIDMIAESSPYVSPGETPTVRDILERARESVGDELAEQPDIAAELLGVIGNSYFGLGDLPTAREVLAEAIDLIETDTVPRLDAATIAGIRYDYASAMQDPEVSPTQARLGLEELGDLEGHESLRANLNRVVAFTHLMAGEARRAEELVELAVELTCGVEKEQPLNEACIVNASELFYYHRMAGNDQAAYETAKWAFEAAREFYEPDPHPHLVTAGLAYSEAMTDRGQPKAAIELLESLRKMARSALEGEGWMTSAIGFRLADAQATAGRDITAVEIWERVLHEVTQQDPQENAIAVQLNFMAQSLLDLLRLEEVKAVYERFDPYLADGVRIGSIDLRALIKLEREWRLGDDQDRQIKSLEAVIHDLQTREVREYEVLLRALVMRWSWSIDIGDLTGAHLWSMIVDASVDSVPHSSLYHVTKARHHTLAGQMELASYQASQALEVFDANGEHDGPRLAAARAVMAGIQCHQGHDERGRKFLDQSLAFWHEARQTRRGEARMTRFATGCPVP